MDNEKPLKKEGLFVGIDVGSSFVHYAVIDGYRNIVYCPKPIMHFADPIDAVKQAWRDIASKYNVDDIKSTAFTGSGAKFFPDAIKGLIYEYDSVTIPKGVELIGLGAEYVFHIGAKDSYFFNLKMINGKAIIQEWGTGSKCGGGSGTLIEKQCRRLFEGEIANPEPESDTNIANAQEQEEIGAGNRRKLQTTLEQMFDKAEKEAVKSTEPSKFLARCGVVIQSDLIHKQNEGAKREDNLAGLFRTVARNYKIDVLGTRQFSGDKKSIRAIATGGVLANDIIKESLEEFLGISISRPKYHSSVAAIGAAQKAAEESNSFIFELEQLDRVAEYGREKRQFAPALHKFLDKVDDNQQQLSEEIKEGTEVVLGIDGGSTTTKGAMVELKTGRLLDKLYIKTHGQPEESLKRVLRYLSRHKDRVIVRGVGATGSARKLYEKILLSKKKSKELTGKGIERTDRITDEITCHALGVKHNNPEIDTIFEVGGQDMKFTSFAADGTVKQAKMNYSCQAGSGQTLENMADIINLDVESSLQEEALHAERVPVIDSTCGVFMEMDENRLIAEGFSRREIAAAILRGTAASYYYKFVGGSQNVGDKCSAQGGPPLGKAFLAALAQVTGKQIEAYPHREMFGAWGQALDIIENIKALEAQGKTCGTAFRGWDVVDMPFKKRKVSCREMFKEKSCGIRDCQLEVFSIEDDEIVSGGFCPRGNSEAIRKPKTNYVERYHKIYEKHFRRFGSLLGEQASEGLAGLKTIGIKRSTATLGEKGIWSAALFNKLGFRPVVSPKTDKEIATTGVDNSRTDFCIARKIATGHAAMLNEHPDIEYMFNPSFIELRRKEPPDLKYCIYTETEGYILNDVLSLDKSRQINPILHFGDEEILVQALRQEFDRLGFGFTEKEVRNSIRFANRAEEEFKREIYDEGNRFLKRIEETDGVGYVGIGRDYVLLDPEASSNSGAMFSQIRGLDYIPQVFLEHRFKDISIERFAENEFWVQSVKILQANLYVANHPNLFPVRMMNFGCGPDSLKIYQEEKIQQAAGKPVLVLLTDAQTNNAPFVTRTEAHERVVSQTKPKGLKPESIALRRYQMDNSDKKIWLIPYMGDGSVVAAVGLKYFGIESMVLPTNTERGYEIARKHISSEVCHPLKGVVGDALSFLIQETEKKGKKYVEDNYLVMLPTTSGPCRFGKYKEVLREFMDREGFEEVPVAGPSSETDYFDIPMPQKIGPLGAMKIQQILFKALKAADLLEDITLRFRPYAEDKRQITELKQQQLNRLQKVIETGAKTNKLIQWGKDTVSKYEQIGLQNIERFPLVLYIGEIYMRHHDPYTNFIIERLEEQDLEMIRDPIVDWLLYVNHMNRRNSRRDIKLSLKHFDLSGALRNMRKFGKSYLKGRYMEDVESKIAGPFHSVLNGRHALPDPMEIIETLEKQNEYHGNIEGESPLSTGIAYYFMNDLIKSRGGAYISGIFHVGPWTCMQEGVATAKIEAMAKELRKKKPDLVFPIIHAFFGDSPNPNLDAEIAVFKEQCYQKREMLRDKYGLKEPGGTKGIYQSAPGRAPRAAVKEIGLEKSRPMHKVGAKDRDIFDSG